MVNPRQRRKLKNPTAPLKKKRVDKHKKKLPDLSIARNDWDKNKSVKYNYEKLGLMRNVNKTRGGISGKVTEDNRKPLDLQDYKHLDANQLSRVVGPGFGVVERDEEGNITNIIIADKEAGLDEAIPPAPAKTEFVKKLEDLASRVAPPVKLMSLIDMNFCETLIKKHGENYQAMSWDHKLNRDQLTAAQCKKLISKYYECRPEV